MITNFFGVVTLLASVLLFYLGLRIKKENIEFRDSEILNGKIYKLGGKIKDSEYSLPVIEYEKFGIKEHFRSTSGIKDKKIGDNVELEFNSYGKIRVKSSSNHYWPIILYIWSLFSVAFGLFLLFSDLKILKI